MGIAVSIDLRTGTGGVAATGFGTVSLLSISFIEQRCCGSTRRERSAMS
jgi:hypothetical protein